MGKEDYLKAKMSKLAKTIKKRQAGPGVVEHGMVFPDKNNPKVCRKKERSSETSRVKPASSRRPPSSSPRPRSPPTRRVTLKPDSSNKAWVEGEGKYGSLMIQQSKADKIDQSDYVGGMRNPYESVAAKSNLLSLGLRVKAAWEAFCRNNKKATVVAEQYGTKDCTLPWTLRQWLDGQPNSNEYWARKHHLRSR